MVEKDKSSCGKPMKDNEMVALRLTNIYANYHLKPGEFIIFLAHLLVVKVSKHDFLL